MSVGFESVPLSGASLGGVELFHGLGSDARQEVAKRCHGRRYGPQSQIVSHDERSGDVFFIVSGSVRVTYYSASGKEVSFRDMHAGQTFGELSAIDGAAERVNSFETPYRRI